MFILTGQTLPTSELRLRDSARMVCTPVVLALGRLKQEEHREFGASLGYVAKSRELRL